MSEMNNNRIKVSAGALILAALIYYTADFGTLACVAVPVLIHELGHIVCLRLLGLRICGFKAELRGLCMGYAGCTSGFGRILAAAAGPAAGGLYALIASYAGKIYGSDWLLCSAGVSVILTAFNMLPSLPLDGGQIFAELAAAAFGGRRGMRLAELTGLRRNLPLPICRSGGTAPRGRLCDPCNRALGYLCSADRRTPRRCRL